MPGPPQRGPVHDDERQGGLPDESPGGIVDAALGAGAAVAGLVGTLAVPVLTAAGAVIALGARMARTGSGARVLAELADRGEQVRAGLEHAVRANVRRLVLAVVDVVDLTELVRRNVDLDALARGIDVDAVVARADIDAVVSRADLDAVVARVDPGWLSWPAWTSTRSSAVSTSTRSWRRSTWTSSRPWSTRSQSWPNACEPFLHSAGGGSQRRRKRERIGRSALPPFFVD